MLAYALLLNDRSGRSDWESVRCFGSSTMTGGGDSLLCGLPTRTIPATARLPCIDVAIDLAQPHPGECRDAARRLEPLQDREDCFGDARLVLVQGRSCSSLTLDPAPRAASCTRLTASSALLIASGNEGSSLDRFITGYSQARHPSPRMFHHQVTVKAAVLSIIESVGHFLDVRLRLSLFCHSSSAPIHIGTQVAASGKWRRKDAVS